MRGWSGGWRAARGMGSWPDVALAAALTLGGQLELASSGATGWHGLTHGMLLLAQTAPVAVRRRWPATAAAVSAAALLVEALATTPTNTLCGLLAGLVLSYSLGRWVAGTRLVLVTTFGALALSAHMLLLPGVALGDLAFAVVFSGAAWLAGRTVRRREEERQRAIAESQVQREAAAAALKAAVTEERTRIARELHDVVAHGMGVMVVQAAAAEQMLAVDPSAAREPLTAVRQTGQGALAEMRRLLGLLRAGDVGDTTEPLPGLAQLSALVDRLRRSDVLVTLTVGVEPGDLPDGFQLCAYRIIQEALTNSLKHAAGALTTIELRHGADALDIRVHNGPGRPTQAPDVTGPGHGLVGMRERARVYGGTLTAGEEPGGGYLVRAVLPVPR